MGKKKEGSQARTRTRVWKKETGKGLQVSNSQTTQVPEPRGVRLEAGPAQGPGPGQGPRTIHTTRLSPTQFNFLVVHNVAPWSFLF